jgi:hypothetical protein
MAVGAFTLINMTKLYQHCMTLLGTFRAMQAHSGFSCARRDTVDYDHRTASGERLAVSEPWFVGGRVESLPKAPCLRKVERTASVALNSVLCEPTPRPRSLDGRVGNCCGERQAATLVLTPITHRYIHGLSIFEMWLLQGRKAKWVLQLRSQGLNGFCNHNERGRGEASDPVCRWCILRRTVDLNFRSMRSAKQSPKVCLATPDQDCKQVRKQR